MNQEELDKPWGFETIREAAVRDEGWPDGANVGAGGLARGYCISQLSSEPGRQNTVKPARTAAERFGIVTMAKKKKLACERPRQLGDPGGWEWWWWRLGMEGGT